MKKILCLLIILILSSCSIAPLSSTKTARSLGKGKWEIDTGSSLASYFSVSRGFTDNFDARATLEYQAFNVFALSGKYSFINREDEGLSFAAIAGGYVGIDTVKSTGFYLGPVLSYKVKWFEPFLILRYNTFEWEGVDLSSDQRDSFLFDLINFDKADGSYFQYTLGFNFWFTPKFALSLNAKFLHFLDDDIIEGSDSRVWPGLGLVWRL